VRRMAPAVVILAALWPGCRRQAGPPAKVAASNSMLECAARDLLGGSETILRLAEPGMCPGHYDIRPGQVAALHGCRVLLRLDFQKSLDRKLAGIEGLRIAESRRATSPPAASRPTPWSPPACWTGRRPTAGSTGSPSERGAWRRGVCRGRRG